MTPRSFWKLFIYSIVAAVLAGYALHVKHDLIGAAAYVLAAALPWCVRQPRTAMFAGILPVLLAGFMPLTALCVVMGLWLLFFLLPKVPVPPTKSELAELKRAAERTQKAQELGNVRMTPSGSMYVVDKHGSWRRVKAS